MQALNIPCGTRHTVHHSLPPSRSLHRHFRLRCPAIPTATKADEALRTKPQIRIEDLEDPAHIGGKAKATVNVQDFGSDLSIEAYMQLPVEQYYELDPNMIRPLGNDRFALQVPRVHLFNVWVEPLVEVHVQQAPAKDAVIIEAKNCSLSGSPLIQNLQLDKRFYLSFKTVLTWSSPAVGKSATSNGNGAQGLQHAAQGQMTLGILNTKGSVKMQMLMQGDAELDVWSEVVQPFHLMPRFMLEGSSNAVMGALLSNLLPRFMDRLSKDYVRWATDANYRASRQSQQNQP